MLMIGDIFLYHAVCDYCRRSIDGVIPCGKPDPALYAAALVQHLQDGRVYHTFTCSRPVFDFAGGTFMGSWV